MCFLFSKECNDMKKKILNSKKFFFWVSGGCNYYWLYIKSVVTLFLREALIGRTGDLVVTIDRIADELCL